MNKISVLVLFLIASGVVNAESANIEIVSMYTVNIGGTNVLLQTNKNSAGQICQSYIANSFRDDKGLVNIQVGEVCGIAIKRQSANGIGGTVYFPDKLIAMKFEPNGDLGKHVLQLNN